MWKEKSQIRLASLLPWAANNVISTLIAYITVTNSLKVNILKRIWLYKHNQHVGGVHWNKSTEHSIIISDRIFCVLDETGDNSRNFISGIDAQLRTFYWNAQLSENLLNNQVTKAELVLSGLPQSHWVYNKIRIGRQHCTNTATADSLEYFICAT